MSILDVAGSRPEKSYRRTWGIVEHGLLLAASCPRACPHRWFGSDRQNIASAPSGMEPCSSMSNTGTPNSCSDSHDSNRRRDAPVTHGSRCHAWKRLLERNLNDFLAHVERSWKSYSHGRLSEIAAGCIARAPDSRGFFVVERLEEITIAATGLRVNRQTNAHE